MTADIRAPNGASSPAPASAIAAVDDFARQLYRRARTAGPEFAEIATEVRGLHTVLKHLRVEAEDPDSLLSQSGTSAESVYAQQLMPVVRDCNFALKGLDTILEKYGGSGGESAEEGGSAGNGMVIAEPKDLESRERLMIAHLQSKLATLKTDIDIFLDTVQLHNPAKARRVLDSTSGQQLDAIKDKVDAIAFRLFRRRGSGGSSETEEDLWLQFRNELEGEGFSSEVLRKNKEVLRAYIRGLESHGLLESDNPPSVRGLLGQQPTNGRPPPMTLTPASYPGPQAAGHMPDLSPTRYNPYAPHSQQLQPHQSQSYQPPAFYPHGSSGLSYERYTSSSDDESDSGLALISTRDLMALDRQEAERLAARMASMHLSPQQLPPPQSYSFSPGTSPNSRYLPAAPQPIPIAGAANTTTLPLPPEHQLSSSPGSQQLLSLSPRYVPPILVPGYGGPAGPGVSPTSPIITPPSAYGTSPTLALPSSGPPAAGSSALTAAVGQLPRHYSRLAPDSTGKEIALDAKWTKIRRTLVSPEVLEQAGVRYEARPEFVAVLGVLSRERIAELAQLSDVVRRSRRRGAANGTGRRREHERGERDRDGRRQYPARHAHGEKDRDASWEDGRDRSHDQERHKHRGARESGDESDVLWDESDTSNSDPEHPRRHKGGRTERSRARDRYTPRTYVDDKSGSSIDRESDDRGTRVYPVIVNPPSMSGANGEGKTSPSSTSMPKPILKNRNENHVRFDDDGPREISQDELRKEREREKRRRERDRDRDKDRPKERDRDRDRDNHGHRRHHGHRERDRDKDKDVRREERAIKKSVWGETLGAVGIGGAAASLLSVLTEAAGGF